LTFTRTVDENSPDEYDDEATANFLQSEVWVGRRAPTTDSDSDSSDRVWREERRERERKKGREGYIHSKNGISDEPLVARVAVPLGRDDRVVQV
jgi:hypothetical protein